MCGRTSHETGLIVLVDDDEAVRGALTMLLQSHGWQVMAFASAPALLAAGTVPQLSRCLILDYQMPEMTGLDLLARLRDAGCNAPAIVITGRVNGRPQIKSCAEALGLAALLDKPLDPDDLIRAVAGAVTRALPSSV